MPPFNIEDILKIVGKAVVPTVVATKRGAEGDNPNNEQKSLAKTD